jgi:hypothetical protein
MTIRNNDGIREFDPLHEKLDLVWGGGAKNDLRFTNYYDYYFSGEDIRVYIDGLFAPEYELDIATFGFNVRQEKQPLYGFWSYNYDAMMYGSRIINGEITIFTRYPRRMTELLEIAAQMRVAAATDKNSPNKIASNLRSTFETEEDERLMDKYWARSQLDRVTQDPFAQNVQNSNRNIFSAHPPFNFVIVYGLEEIALTPTNAFQNQDEKRTDLTDQMMISDYNQRTVKSSNLTTPMKIILQEVNLMNMSMVYTPGGQALAETYQFIARDHYFSEVPDDLIKTGKAFVTSNTPNAATQTQPQVPVSSVSNWQDFLQQNGQNLSF